MGAAARIIACCARTASIIGLAIALSAPLAIGCGAGREPGAPIHVALLPYAGPGEGDRGDFVVGYHPWGRGSIDGATGRGGTTLAKLLDDAIVRCRNVECSYSGKTRMLVVPSPPLELANIEVTIQKEGYEPLEVRVPVSAEPHDQSMLVVLTPSRPK